MVVAQPLTTPVRRSNDISAIGKMPKPMREFIQITRALADETRVRVLLALRGRALCACQITALFDWVPSTMSQHLGLLREAGLVDPRKAGRWVYYSLPGKAASAAVRTALRWVQRSLADDPQAIEDRRRLRQVLALAPAELCRRQCREGRSSSPARAIPPAARWLRVGAATCMAAPSRPTRQNSRSPFA